MANPNINTITDIFLPDGYGAFGFGDGGFGGNSELLNPQWNTNSGNFGIDEVNGLAYVEADSPPSFVGAAMYNLEYSSFFAKITPVLTGNGSIQTALVIKHDAHNYVEMSLGPDNVFHAYVSNDSNIVSCSPNMPAYSPTAHAYWRIRNDDKLVFHFDVSPDGSTWTELGTAPYTWDASAVVVTIFAGFTGLEAQGQRAYISNVNLPGTSLQLSSTAKATSAAGALATITSPNSLSGRASASAVTRGSFKAVLALPQGGITDVAYVANTQSIDPLMQNSWNSFATAQAFGSNPIQWNRGSYGWTAPSAYRDGSYWQQAAYGLTRFRVSMAPNSNPTLMTNMQFEETKGLNNLLSENSSIYTNSAPYGPSTTFGTSAVNRVTSPTYTGHYAVSIKSTNTPVAFVSGDNGYFPLPELSSLIKVRRDTSGSGEASFASVYMSTQRAGTKWQAGILYYDANYNLITNESSYNYSPDINFSTHPGGGVWQASSVYHVPSNPSIVYMAVVPIVVNNGNLVETVYMSNNSIITGSPNSTEVATPYVDPRTTNINVKADRVNYCLNSGFNQNINQWVQDNRSGITGTPNAATAVFDSVIGHSSSGSLRMDMAVPSGTFTGTSSSTIGVSTRSRLISTSTGRYPVVSGLKKGHTYTISMWIKQGAGCPNVYMDFTDNNSVGFTTDLNTIRSTSPDNIEGSWTRLQYTYTLPPNSTEDFAFYVYVKYAEITSTPFSFWIDDILVEESTTYDGYFDGGFASTDYQWESGGTANIARSYYYKDYGNKRNHLQTALNNVMPIGETFNLLFAQPIT